MTTPHERIAAGYIESDAGKRRDSRLAATHRHSAYYEELAALYETNRGEFDKLPRQARMAFGHYMEAKQAAERMGDL